MWATKQAILTEHARETLAQTRKRTCDGHRASLKVAGFDELAGENCTEELGDITTIGEQYVTHQQNRSSAPLWLAALGAAAATGLIAWLLSDPLSPPSDTDGRNFYTFGVDVERGGALPDGEISR